MHSVYCCIPRAWLKMAELIELIKKPQATSVVWNYCGLKADDKGVPIAEEEHRPVCRTCKKSEPAKGGNTSNLMSHMKDHHPILYTEAFPGPSNKVKSTVSKNKLTGQPSIMEIVESGKTFNPQSPQALEINRTIAYFIAKDAQPFTTVERPECKALIAKLSPRYVIPSRKHFVEHEIPQLYREVKENIVQRLQEAEFFAVTTDLWTSNSNNPFMSFTVHFIDSNWDFQSLCLDTVSLFEDHTGQNIADAFEEVLGNWNLCSSRLVTTTTDNGTNYVAAFTSLE